MLEFQKLNPLSYVPVLVDEDIVIADSYAIIMVSIRSQIIYDENSIALVSPYWNHCWKELHLIMQYLEEKYPQNPLLPQNFQKRGLNYQVLLTLSFLSFLYWWLICAVYWLLVVSDLYFLLLSWGKYQLSILAAVYCCLHFKLKATLLRSLVRKIKLCPSIFRNVQVFYCSFLCIFFWTKHETT